MFRERNEASIHEFSMFEVVWVSEINNTAQTTYSQIYIKARWWKILFLETIFRNFFLHFSTNTFKHVQLRGKNVSFFFLYVWIWKSSKMITPITEVSSFIIVPFIQTFVSWESWEGEKICTGEMLISLEWRWQFGWTKLIYVYFMWEQKFYKNEHNDDDERNFHVKIYIS